MLPTLTHPKESALALFGFGTATLGIALLTVALSGGCGATGGAAARLTEKWKAITADGVVTDAEIEGFQESVTKETTGVNWPATVVSGVIALVGMVLGVRSTKGAIVRDFEPKVTSAVEAANRALAQSRI